MNIGFVWFCSVSFEEKNRSKHPHVFRHDVLFTRECIFIFLSVKYHEFHLQTKKANSEIFKIIFLLIPGLFLIIYSVDCNCIWKMSGKKHHFDHWVYKERDILQRSHNTFEIKLWRWVIIHIHHKQRLHGTQKLFLPISILDLYQMFQQYRCLQPRIMSCHIQNIIHPLPLNLLSMDDKCNHINNRDINHQE